MAKVAINGFGRIGRQVFKRILQMYPDLDVVAINDLTDTKTLAHLLQYDSNYGMFGKEVIHKERAISINGKEYAVLAEKDPAKLPWKKLGVDIVLECTGFFTDKESAGLHLAAGAKKVIISAPCKSKDVPSFVLGVNAEKYDGSVDVMDMGSCTTNCLATVAKVLQDNFGIEKGFMTTVHSYTNDQSILDLPHKDLRRARAAAVNIIPTSTGAAKAIGKVIPQLEGKLDGIAIRVPTPVVSVLDLIVNVDRATTKEEVNEAFQLAAAKDTFKGILGVEEQPLVSSDFKGDSRSSIVDLQETMVSGNLVKVLAWYDNEWGFSCRLAEFTEFVASQLNMHS
ncbi:MAG TPA: type I glyceraldehyde-3-phosphate dehydrogenase [Negativicutes bacterium]|uniref:Type I glyceraldehyde-3-phosphate dehydrogenase n=1 Tax=Candidatus Staskawiczbacteria bacterium RIFCSPHIGHO2_01_FULL_41_41 TaxID=1802203 RepID=A0A1G2HTN1_9BACT|nr:MAG: type I glyceraldehyde-3-phosphate dehydrogenase [Candidatus Staskawiczbacteria bacterium RIFCSPHIGHO2_01_FULL_41_41]OGZ68326.1 MAG: type I glyceraldehyde-3-phosphate dehydrogenase [Candidatus Staskawiczbacteria bacterium RIFCSPHIGHO2_02_FULL_43_16]OGZ75117.1 MAG: type I glyceraldehyde-3-phosphate dehydrogenase [Candidatus Staskawiczbacteria bacterium RIFCSPLOWO2_01_FULL_43_17b]HLD70542.1 type I glyceraldehyde-3-phosphate dehydrogenase [Negativicutes bacterium]